MSSPWPDPTAGRAPRRGARNAGAGPGLDSRPSNPSQAARSAGTSLSTPRRAVAQRAGEVPDQGALARAGTSRRRLEDERTLLQGNRQVLARAGASQQLIAPTGEGVDPGPHREVIQALLGDRDGPVPAVVVRRRHRQRRPAAGRLVAVADSHQSGSCPSTNASASTDSRSPTVALAGRLPSSTCGWTSRTTGRAHPRGSGSSRRASVGAALAAGAAADPDV